MNWRELAMVYQQASRCLVCGAAVFRGQMVLVDHKVRWTHSGECHERWQQYSNVP